ncbi:MAG: hypothetical protein U9R44_02205 [Candidatus Omnitrophota bacterium]|nr:hypothetical protein [Candidatus Omnitrophota bacterium]
MRLYKFIFTGCIITIMAIGFVHQRVEIVKTGYGLQKSRKYLSCLVDQNSRLMYDLSRLESPRYLLASLDYEEIEFARHKNRKAESYRLARAGSREDSGSGGLIVRLLDLFKLGEKNESRE